MAQKMLGRGTKLYISTNGVAYTQVPSLKSLSEIRKTSSKVDVTDLDDVAHAYLPGLPDPSTISAEGYWEPLNPTHQQLDTGQRAGTVFFWKIELYRSAALIRTGLFTGYIAEFASGPFDFETPVAMPLVIQLSGDVAWS